MSGAKLNERIQKDPVLFQIDEGLSDLRRFHIKLKTIKKK